MWRTEPRSAPCACEENPDAFMMMEKRPSSVLADFRPFTISCAAVITAPSSPRELHLSVGR
jgi:hypothetical protein